MKAQFLASKKSWSSCPSMGGKKLYDCKIIAKYRERHSLAETLEQYITYPHSKLCLSRSESTRASPYGKRNTACAENWRGKKTRFVCRIAVAGHDLSESERPAEITPWAFLWWNLELNFYPEVYIKHLHVLSRRVTQCGLHFRWGEKYFGVLHLKVTWDVTEK